MSEPGFFVWFFLFNLWYTITMLNSLINPQALGEISKDLGQIFFASVFVAGLLGGTINYFNVITGLILSIVFCWTGIIGLVLGIIAIVFGAKKMRIEEKGKGMAVAGFVLGIIGTFLSSIFLIIWIIIISFIINPNIYFI